MKVGIIGAGLVGSTTAYTLAIEGTVREIVLVDINKVRAEAEADDIIHATAFKQDCTIYEGDYSDLKGADVVIITAGRSAQFYRLPFRGLWMAIQKCLNPLFPVW